jgi:hypothetical protein
MSGKGAYDRPSSALLEQAYALSADALSIIDRLLPDGITFATMPAASIHKLHLSGTANYRAGLVCLGSAETSVGAFSLLRGVLEAWSHIAFIADNDEGGDAQCRALRYERGALKEWEGNIHTPPPGFDEKRWVEAHKENAAEVNSLWASHGCGKASPRTRAHVDRTLKKIAKEPSFGWVIPLWRSTSATVHMYGSDFFFESHGDGNSELVWAQPRYRATWLSFLGASYSYLTVTAASLLKPNRAAGQEIAQFHERMRRIIEDTAVKKAISGAFDR